MSLNKLQSVPAWIITDLDDSQAFGPVRLGPKVLQSTAKQYARAETYKLALINKKASGAAAGIKVDTSDRSDQVAKFVEEVAPLVEAASFHPDAAWGLDEQDLLSLRPGDPRNSFAWPSDSQAELIGAGATAILEVALDGLTDKTIVLGSLSARHVAFAEAAIEAGAKIVGAEHRAGSHVNSNAMTLSSIQELVDGAETNSAAGAATSVECDAFIPAGLLGAIDHLKQESIGAKNVLGLDDLCITPRGLATLSKRGVTVWPEFLATAAVTHAAHGESANLDDAITAASHHIASLAERAATAEEGPFLGICHIAEEFLASWQETLPFGRPMP